MVILPNEALSTRRTTLLHLLQDPAPPSLALVLKKEGSTVYQRTVGGDTELQPVVTWNPATRRCQERLMTR